jgi:hypothetical protein
MTELMYMASPYLGGTEKVTGYTPLKSTRYQQAVNAAAELTNSDRIVFSPIVHSHPLAMKAGLPGNFEFWNYFDTKIIEACDSFGILQLNGWDKSSAHKNELSLAIKFSLPVYEIDPFILPLKLQPVLNPVALLKELNR